MAYTTLKNGSKDQNGSGEVSRLQQSLKDKGYEINVDGIYGPKTTEVVKQYQNDKKLSVDGIAGNETLSSLYGTDNTAADSGADNTKTDESNSDDILSKNRDTYKKNAEENIKKGEEEIDKTTTKQKEILNENYNTKIDALPQEYQSAYDAAEVNRLVGERNIKEYMANNGLTDSGLHRTESTALRVSQMNANAALMQQEQAAARELERELNGKISELEIGAEQSKSTLRQKEYTNAEANAISATKSYYDFLNKQSKNQTESIKNRNTVLNDYISNANKIATDVAYSYDGIEVDKGNEEKTVDYVYSLYESGKITDIEGKEILSAVGIDPNKIYDGKIDQVIKKIGYNRPVSEDSQTAARENDYLDRQFEFLFASGEYTDNEIEAIIRFYLGHGYTLEGFSNNPVDSKHKRISDIRQKSRESR